VVLIKRWRWYIAGVSSGLVLVIEECSLGNVFLMLLIALKKSFSSPEYSPCFNIIDA
jgi:hypothetical protein